MKFAHSKPLTLGVEVEIQLIDPLSRDLTPRSIELLEIWGESKKLKPEFFQSMIEVNTDICADAHEVEQDLDQSFRKLMGLADKMGIRLASSGSHPFARYQDRILFPASRYHKVLQRNQWIARRLLIYGLHIHIGCESGESCVSLNNFMLRYLPEFLALSASSPYFQGEDTGLQSSRITAFEAMPTGGHPSTFENWKEFGLLVEKLKRAKAIFSVKDIWWDLRPSPGFGTLEIRICDGITNLQEISSIVAYIHLLAIRHHDEKYKETKPMPEWILRENKWRASRHGLQAELIVNDAGDTRPVEEIIRKNVEELEPLINKMKYQKYIENLLKIFKTGNSAFRQKNDYAKSNLLTSVVDQLCEEFNLQRPQG